MLFVLYVCMYAYVGLVSVCVRVIKHIYIYICICIYIYIYVSILIYRGSNFEYVCMHVKIRT